MGMTDFGSRMLIFLPFLNLNPACQTGLFAVQAAFAEAACSKI
jgi:hypothetical protein